MWGTAAIVWERSALGEASVSCPSWRRVTPPGRTPRRMRRWIVSCGGQFQSHAITDHPTHRKPSLAVVDTEEGRERSCGVVYRILAALQLLANLAWPAPGEVGVGEGVVPDGVPGGDLGRQVRLSPDVVPYLEEGR